MATQKHTARGPTNVWNAEETIWQPNAKNLEKKPAKCALCSSQHTANYKGCTDYKDLQNAKNNLTNRKQQIPNRQTITQNNTNHSNTQHKIRTSSSYSQVINGNNNTNQTDNISIQLNTFLNEFKKMFSQLINQNSMILSMLTTIINNRLNNGH